jgi:hypothetical protein
MAATIPSNQLEDRGLMFSYAFRLNALIMVAESRYRPSIHDQSNLPESVSIPKTCQVLWLPDLIREHPGIAWLTLLRPVSASETDQILSDTSMRPSAADDLELSARLWKKMEE